jgi:hypothetical protein
MKASVTGKLGRATSKVCPDTCLTTERNHQKPQCGQPKSIKHYLLRRICRLIRDSFDWLAEQRPSSVNHGWLETALGRHKCSSKLPNEMIPTQANQESKLPADAVMRSAKNGILKFSWICLLVAMREKCYCKIFIFRRSLRAADLQMGHL